MLKKKTVVELGNLLTIESLTCDTIHNLIDSAELFAHTSANSVHSLLTNKVIANLFFEPSTRTQYSFEIAAKNLGANIISPAIYNLSTLKGESLLDTIHTFEAMGVALFIVRHNVNHTPEFLSSELNGDAKILNAGDGTHQHPSQCLIDLMTIKQHTKNFESISVAILGDVFRSRVAHSLIAGLQIMGTTDIRCITPEPLIPEHQQIDRKFCTHTIDSGLKDADVIVCLRVQKERMQDNYKLDEDTYFKKYALTLDRLKLASHNAIVLHPGPINRGFEIDSLVADSDHSMILQQPKNSIPMRMAILHALLT